MDTVTNPHCMTRSRRALRARPHRRAIALPSRTPVAKNSWYVLRVEFGGVRFRVSLDGKAYLEVDDHHIAGAGTIGVWTKVESVTAFDDFAYGTLAAR